MDKPEVLKMNHGPQLALIEALLLSVLLKLGSLVCQGTSRASRGGCKCKSCSVLCCKVI